MFKLIEENTSQNNWKKIKVIQKKLAVLLLAIEFISKSLNIWMVFIHKFVKSIFSNFWNEILISKRIPKSQS